MMNKCKCGCGKEVKKTWRKGHNRLGISPTNKKGRTLNFGGYFEVYIPNHPHSKSNGYYQEHRVVMEKEIGRFLIPGKEVVHHKNGIRTDNRIENLQLLTKKQHDRETVLVSEKCLHGKCKNKHRARGLCRLHYDRYERQKINMPLNPSRGNRWSKK